MDRIRASLDSALTQTSERSEKHLPDEEFRHLGILLAQMAKRYPSQDLEESLEGYLWDLERLALRYSLQQVQDALAELRIKPGQNFFPRPDEVAEVIASKCERTEADVRQIEGRMHRQRWAKWVEQYNSQEERAWRIAQGYEKPPEAA